MTQTLLRLLFLFLALGVPSVAAAEGDADVEYARSRVEGEKLKDRPVLSLSSDASVGFRGNWNLGANLRLEWNLLNPEGPASLKAAQTALRLAKHNSAENTRLNQYQAVRTARTYLYLEEILRTLVAARNRLEERFQYLGELAEQFSAAALAENGDTAVEEGDRVEAKITFLELIQVQNRTVRELEEIMFQLTSGPPSSVEPMERAAWLSSEELPHSCSLETGEVVRAQLLLEEATYLEELREASSKPRVLLHGTAGGRASGDLGGGQYSSDSASLSTSIGLTVQLPKAAGGQGSAGVQLNTTGVSGNLHLRFQPPQKKETGEVERARANLERALREAEFAIRRGHALYEEAQATLHLASLRESRYNPDYSESTTPVQLAEAVTTEQEQLERKVALEAARLERDLALLDLQRLCGVL